MTVHYNCAKCKDRLCIHKVPIFSSLDSEDLRKIMGLISHSEYKKGETIVFEQEEPDSVIIINEGSAKAYKNTATDVSRYYMYFPRRFLRRTESVHRAAINIYGRSASAGKDL